MVPSPKKSLPVESPVLRWYAVAFGAFLGLAFLKFPNPSVLEHLAVAPNGLLEWLLTGWPVRYAYPLLGALVMVGLGMMRWPPGVSRCLALLPLLWLGWVALSCVGRSEHRASLLILEHFGACLACFYMGLLVLGRLRQSEYLFLGVAGGLLVVMAAGWEQHFGGLERTREFFYTNIYPTHPEVPPDLLRRMQSDRIFGTLFYPNSLAGVVLLVVPLVLGVIADARTAFTVGARRLLGGLVLVGAAGCLVWSGSKSGWLLAMLGLMTVLLRSHIHKQVKVIVVAVILILGAAGFTIRYSAFFRRGATSVVARVDYWTAAVQNTKSHPMLGSGPGTFADVYQELKPPEAEMTRLVHNDYLQQASDSGLPSALLFTGMVFGVLWVGWRRVRQGSWMEFGVVLGLSLFALQSFTEFGFYIPATAWCWFTLAGCVVGRSRIGFDNADPPA